ncbi:hypothetical protein E2C01_044030 [Portunus trituberculatus]|uniref:Uncharacterized protein n=1 Tax=Portunus trituberculatus TaxID=210409 RepID=A0A5B7FXQ8_PORTR|nr:hypothetical protein [Portunus trituberculatus]
MHQYIFSLPHPLTRTVPEGVVEGGTCPLRPLPLPRHCATGCGDDQPAGRVKPRAPREDGEGSDANRGVGGGGTGGDHRVRRV